MQVRKWGNPALRGSVPAPSKEDSQALGGHQISGLYPADDDDFDDGTQGDDFSDTTKSEPSTAEIDPHDVDQRPRDNPYFGGVADSTLFAMYGPTGRRPGAKGLEHRAIKLQHILRL